MSPDSLIQARLFSSTQAERWVENETIPVAALPAKAADLSIDPDGLAQEVRGFGGTFNELGWDALQVLSEDARDEVIENLFGADGARFSLARTPIGASDYALSYYSYCDVKDDFTMRDFSIARDRYILIPYIKKALALRPDLKIWGSPWTPPAWMKINEHYTLQAGDIEGRAGGNEMDARKNVMSNATAFNMQSGYLQAYARYFARYVQEYARAGVDLWAIMPQNEIAWSPNWPCCTWRPDDLAHFIGEYLGPEFERARIATEIWLGTINYFNSDYVRTVLGNEAAAKYVKGIGFQWSGSEAIGAIYAEYPSHELMQTENMCGNGENDWSSLENSWKAVLHYFRNGAGSYMYWNMVLDETGKSSWGWPQNSLVVINRQTGQVTYTGEFCLMKHLSRFVQPGSRLLCMEGYEDALAFHLPDHRVAVFVYNPESMNKDLTIAFGQSGLSVSLKPKSINTLVLT